MVNAPLRIAFLRPELELGLSEPLRDGAALVLWVHAFARCVSHRQLAVLDPDESWITTASGIHAPGPERNPAWPVVAMMDEHWRDRMLCPVVSREGTSLKVELLSHDRHAVVRSFEALGEPEALGSLFDRVLGLWLAAEELEPLPERPAFGLGDLLSVTEAIVPVLADAVAEERPIVDEAEGDPEAEDETPVALPVLPAVASAMQVAALRALHVALDLDVTGPTLAVDPEDPWALVETFEQDRDGGEDFTVLRRALDRAPWWSRALSLLTVPEETEDAPTPGQPTDLEALGARGAATVSSPASVRVRSRYAAELGAAGRVHEVARLHTRTRDAEPYRPSAWLPLLACQKRLETPGAAENLGGWAAGTVGLVVGGRIMPWSEPRMRVDLWGSVSLRNVGLLGEAIVLRDNRLEGLESRYPKEVRVLEGWRKEARYVAWAFAREGYYRGEDARVLEGFSRAEPNDGVDLGMFLESLLACGRVQDALYAWAHLGRGRGLDTPFATLPAVDVLIAAGRHVEAFELRLRHMLQHPGRGDEAAVDRRGRALVGADVSALASWVQGWADCGAPHLATLAAREVADFVPGGAARVARHLSPPRARFDAAWLEAFEAVPSVTALFETDARDLVAADALVDTWSKASRAGLGEKDRAGIAGRAAYVFASALTRYLGDAQGGPWAGALRTVASEALLVLRDLEGSVKEEDVRAVLESLVPLAAAGEPRLAAWLARLDRAIDLEGRSKGALETLCPAAVAEVLPSPERIALWTLEAARHPERAEPLLRRVVEATGPACAGAWAQAAFESEDASSLDVLWTASFIAAGVDAEAAVLCGRRLFALGRDEEAYAVLCEGMAAARSKPWRDAQLAILKPLWEASSLELPFDFGPGVTMAVEALQQSDGARAERPLRWLLSVDPDNEEGHRNFGMAYAMQGKVEEALTEFAKASRDQDTQFASGTLFHAGHPQLSMQVLDYASQWYTRAEQWITFGAIAYQVMDNPRTMIAYGNAWQLDPDAFDASNLNSWAGVLDEVGDYAMCERIARRLLEAAGDDAMWASNGWNHLACAMIGLGRLDEAKAHAHEAIAMNPLPDNEAAFADTLARAQSGARPAVPPDLPPPVPRHAAFEALEAGDTKAVVARFEGESDWESRLVVLRASRFRFGSDNYVPVTQRAQEAAARLMEDTRGATDPWAVLARVCALTVREQAEFAMDPLPNLGDRGTREAFYSEFRDRGGIIVGDPGLPPEVFEDVEVCPETALPRASDYVRALQALASQPPGEALAGLGISTEAFEAAAVAWGAALRRDEGLRRQLAVGMRMV